MSHARPTILALVFLLVLAGASAVSAEGLLLYVSPTGNDQWSGRLVSPNTSKTDGPLATLAGARDAIRKLREAGPLPAGGITVELAGGVYELANPLELQAKDSGTAESPIVYRGREGAEVRLVGGRVVTGWRPVTDAAVLARLDEAARGHVLQADLKAQGVADLGQMKPGHTWAQSDAGLELFFQDAPDDVGPLAQRGVCEDAHGARSHASGHPRHEGVQGRRVFV